MEFTKQQKKVIEHNHTKNGVVRAGPGTGKSMTVVALAERLASEGKAGGVKFLTFTRAATSELSKKISSTEGLTIKPSTVHSFAISILMKNQDALPMKLPLRIPSEVEQEKIIYPYISKRARIGKNKIKKMVHHMASMWESLSEEDNSNFTTEERSRFNASFQSAGRLFGFTLLSQLPDLLRKMLSEQSEIKGLDLTLLIVDEYQDLNKCEVEMLKLLQGRGISVLAVGDEDQSIYSFRRAHPAGIREFEQTFENSEVYDLSVCHRCPQNLIDWAQYVIKGDLSRASIPVPQSTSTNNAKTFLLHFKSDTTEAQGVSHMVENLIQKKGFNACDILVLTRTDLNERFTKVIKKELISKGIPVSDQKTYKEIIESGDIVNLLALLRIINNKNDSLAWVTLMINKRGLGRSKIEQILIKAEVDNVEVSKIIWEEINTNYPTINAPKFKELAEFIQKVLVLHELREGEHVTCWGKWIVDHANEIFEINIGEELGKLLLEVDKRVEVQNPSLGFFISQMSPILKDFINEKQDGVRFMTMQSSKGLTARATIVVGVDNDLVPNPKNKIDEERRLLYVAMTRSQEVLIMTWANRRVGNQAHSGRPNVNRRNYTDFLQNGPVKSLDGEQFVNSLK